MKSSGINQRVRSSCVTGFVPGASNPCLRDIHEYLLVFSKVITRCHVRRKSVSGRIDTIEKQEFIDHTKSIWRFATERASRANHPAPFPVKLVAASNCTPLQVMLFSIRSMVQEQHVAAKQTGRTYIGVDLSPEYCQIAEERLIQTPAFEMPESKPVV